MTVTDTFNRPATVVSVRASQGSCTKSIPMSCRLGTIEAGQSVTVTVVVKPLQGGCNQRNAASASANGTDTDPANNIDTVNLCVDRIPLRLSKTSTNKVVRAGQTFGYTIRVTNPTKAPHATCASATASQPGWRS